MKIEKRCPECDDYVSELARSFETIVYGCVKDQKHYNKYVSLNNEDQNPVRQLAKKIYGNRKEK